MWVAVAGMAACGGGGNGAGTDPFGAGSGTSTFGAGSGSTGFNTGGGAGGTTGQVGDGPLPTADPTVVVSTAAIQGQVFNAGSGAALGGAAISATDLSLTTDNSGFYSQSVYPAIPRRVLRAAADGFEPVYTPATVVAGVPTVTLFKLTERGLSATVNPTTGGQVTAADTVGRVNFVANSLETSPGVPATSVSVRLTTLSISGDTFRVSGDYRSSADETLEALGAVVLANGDGAQIVAGRPALLRVPISTRSTIRPVSATLYRLDESTATWVAAGAATLDANGTYYEGNATQFGQWMVGEAIAQPVTVSGCVVDDAGAPAANVRIAVEGVSYSGASFTSTGINGAFVARVKPNSVILMAGRRGSILTNAASTSSGTSGVVVSTCLTLPSTNAATVRMTWGQNPRDIDSHAHEPGGAHVYFNTRGSLTAEPFVNLDVDDTSGFGPEITTIRRPKVGIYRFYAHNYSRTFSPGIAQSPTSVELNYVGRTIVFSPPANEGTSLYWHLFDLKIGTDCAMTLYRYNRWRADEPANPNTTATTQVCVPN